MITVVGGVYRERCMRPNWQETYGSAGRAATAIARLEGQVELHSYLDADSLDVMQSRAFLEGFKLIATEVEQGVSFDYTHGLVSPYIHRPTNPYPALKVNAERVLRFGMIESTAVVECEYAVYDPQNVANPESFRANGSKAKHLALILNRYEAGVMCGTPGAAPEALAKQLAAQEEAEVVVIKMGPKGALVYCAGKVSTVPAYRTSRVWKIGSGDNFVAQFAFAWMQERRSPHEAAEVASRATAFYCENQGFPNCKRLSEYSPTPLTISKRFRNGSKPKVYLAGPFFTLAQLWMVREARNNLRDMGLDVFSPYHDVGRGSAEDVVEKDLEGIRECDLLFAIGDGLDAGTIYEIGYARALSKPVVVYAENESEEDKKMMEGSDCELSNDYVTAIYKATWAAAAL